jgi:HemY protein
VLALTEGRFSRVEHLAVEAQVNEPDARPSALIAAMAAHRLRLYDRRDRWLNPLRQEGGEVGLAANLVAAECCLEQGDKPAALAAIESVLEGNRRNLRAQQVAYRVFKATGQWDSLLRVSRLLVNRNAVEDLSFDETISEAYRNLVSRRAQSIQQLWVLWRNATPRELGLLEVVRAFAQGFSRAGGPTHAKSLIEDALSRNWNGELVQLYAELFYSQPVSAIRQLEVWRGQHPDDPAVLGALGLLNGAIENWQGSADFYERLFALRPSPDVAAQLARVYSRLGDGERESQYRTQCIALLLKV